MSPGSWIFVVVLAMVGLGSLLALNRRAFDIAKGLDRRWIFLMMLLAVAIPILGQLTFPETATGLAKAVFEEIEKLEEGDSVILSFDFDPASEGELGPMATAFTRHCCEKKLKMIYMALWPVGPQMIEQAINTVIRSDCPDYSTAWTTSTWGTSPATRESSRSSSPTFASCTPPTIPAPVSRASP
jgi:hypothetical protein